MEEDIALYTNKFKTENVDQYTLLILSESAFPETMKPLWKVHKNLKKVLDFIGEYIVVTSTKNKTYNNKIHSILAAKIDACKLF